MTGDPAGLAEAHLRKKRRTAREGCVGGGHSATVGFSERRGDCKPPCAGGETFSEEMETF